jgi:hypothetical protein
MAQSKERKVFAMGEKIYKTVSRAGAWNLALGIVVLVTGIAAGTMMVISGAKLIKQKYEITI